MREYNIDWLAKDKTQIETVLEHRTENTVKYNSWSFRENLKSIYYTKQKHYI